MTTAFSRDDARRFYDRFGARQDRQGFYENAALDALVRNGRFGEARAVIEIGCGTGRLAARLLSDEMPATARYAGIDISATMVDLAKTRLAAWPERAEVRQSDGGFDFPADDGPFDRIVATYVFDLLDDAAIDAAVASAHAVLSRGGLLCAAGLTHGTGPLSRVTSTLWTLARRIRPELVGGCRPLVLAERLAPAAWRIAHREVVVSATVPSEVLVVEAI